MATITLLIAVIALGIAIVALRRTGGMKGLRHQVEGLSCKSETARGKTANALNRLERLIRGKEKPRTETEDKSDEPAEPSDPQ